MWGWLLHHLLLMPNTNASITTKCEVKRGKKSIHPHSLLPGTVRPWLSATSVRRSSQDNWAGGCHWYYALQELLHLSTQDVVLLDHKYFETFLVLSPLESTVDLMMRCRWILLNRSLLWQMQEPGFGWRLWLLVSNIQESLNRILEGMKKHSFFGTEFAEVTDLEISAWENFVRLVYAYVYMCAYLYKGETELIVYRYR